MTLRDPIYRVATVFGGAGFIGRHLVRQLARRGWRVRVATRDPSRALSLKPSGAVGQIAPIFVNVHDDASVAAAVRDADYVINLIGVLYETRREPFQKMHVEVAGRIATAAAAAGCRRMVQISALGADAQAKAAYAKTKAAGEEAVRAAFPTASILRPSIVFGPEDQFYNLFADMARMSPVLPLIGGGETRFQPVYVVDVADAIMACLDRADALGKTFEVGGPLTYTFREVLTYIMDVTRRPRPLITLPWGIARLQGRILQQLPKPLLTVDQVTMLETDNVLTGANPDLSALGISPTAAEAIVPSYLWRFRPGGRFADRRPA